MCSSDLICRLGKEQSIWGKKKVLYHKKYIKKPHLVFSVSKQITEPLVWKGLYMHYGPMAGVEAENDCITM